MNLLAGKLEREEWMERRELTKERIKLKYRKYVEVVKGGKNNDDLVKCHNFFFYKEWSLSLEGLLSTGAYPV